MVKEEPWKLRLKWLNALSYTLQTRHLFEMQDSQPTTFALSKTFLVVILAIGTLFGMALSDFATCFRLPYGPYLLELVHEDTRRGDFICMRKASQLGQNISVGNTKTLHQEGCAMVVSGVPNKDGSFDAYPGWETWYGRLENLGKPVRIPASEIKTLNLLL